MGYLKIVYHSYISNGMNTALSIFSAKFSFLKRFLREKNPAQKIVFLLFLLVFLAVMLAEFFGFLRAFNILKTREFFGPPLTLFILEEFLLLVSVLFFASASITGFFLIYKSADLKFLLSFPLKSTTIYSAKFFETLILSSWPLLILGTPLVFAFGISHNAGVLFYLQALTVLAFFLFFIVSVASLADLLLALTLKRVSKFAALVLLVLTILTSAYALALFLVPKEATIAVIFQADDLEKTIATTGLIENAFKNLPNHWLAMTIFRSAENPRETLNFIFYSAVTALISFLLNLILAKKLYRNILLKWQEGTFYAQTRRPGMAKTGKRLDGSIIFPKFLRGKTGALLEKELLVFFRNYEELSRAFFLLFLLLIYLLITIALGRRIEDIAGYPKELVLTLHLIVISYFANTLALRFVYPSMSLEGRGAWILWSSPVKIGRLFFAKYALWSLILFFATLILMLAVSFGLNFSLQTIAVSVFMLFLLISTITAIALGFGTIFVNFRETNVERLATSFGGLGTTFFALGYGLFMGIINALAVSASSPIFAAYWIITALAISALLIYIFLYSGYKKIMSLEVV